MQRCKKCQSVLEYSLLVAIVVAALLTMQVFVKRSMQGNLQVTGDGLAEPYSYTLTDLHEHVTSQAKTTDWALPGPVNKIRTSGTYESSNKKVLGHLSEESIYDSNAKKATK